MLNLRDMMVKKTINLLMRAIVTVCTIERFVAKQKEWIIIPMISRENMLVPNFETMNRTKSQNPKVQIRHLQNPTKI